MTKSDWKPDEEAALKALIRATVMNIGPIDPATLPSKVRKRIKDQISGDFDIDAYVREILKETQKK
ncbi:hypothetical protein [Hyphococcus sp. DH-69]|uniref:hypothetical protein n=1 Tax=Hyphococcus formosus TaxID=3143534 RepID=UPI00398B7B75